MGTRHPLGIVGGGLAGLSAAIAAAQRGHRVIVWESGVTGRDKVCGEFLSPEVDEDLGELGCSDWIDALDPAPMHTVSLFGPRGARLDLALPGPPAHSLTRRALEGYLARRARAEGVTVLEHAPVRALERLPAGILVRTEGGDFAVRGAVMAFGKRSALDGALRLPRARRAPGHVAMKAYVDAAPLEADVELYVFPGGYVGWNRVEDGRVGVCALLEGDARPDWETLVERAEGCPALGRRLASCGGPNGKIRGLARFGFGAQAVARRTGAQGGPLLFAGDAARLIPSFTGDGMAVALRGGRIAALALEDADPVTAYRRAFHRAFSGRFAMASALHRLFFAPPMFAALAPLVARRPGLAARLYAWTRGAPAHGWG
jgi:flavin-dependent dehydrogenase